MAQATLVASIAASAGCYHYSFEHAPERGDPDRPAPVRTVTYDEHVPTYLNGFVGTGTIDTRAYCEEPVRTELRVTALDVLASVGTLLIYTPHTLYVTCEAGSRSASR